MADLFKDPLQILFVLQSVIIPVFMCKCSLSNQGLSVNSYCLMSMLELLGGLWKVIMRCYLEQSIFCALNVTCEGL